MKARTKVRVNSELAEEFVVNIGMKNDQCCHIFT